MRFRYFCFFRRVRMADADVPVSQLAGRQAVEGRRRPARIQLRRRRTDVPRVAVEKVLVEATASERARLRATSCPRVAVDVVVVVVVVTDEPNAQQRSHRPYIFDSWLVRTALICLNYELCNCSTEAASFRLAFYVLSRVSPNRYW